MLSFLEVTDGFIKLAQQPHNSEFEQWASLPNQVRLRMLDVGVLEITPESASDHALVVSCGVHGNETAPIEIVSELISKIVTGVIHPKVKVLFILGNPRSMAISERFVSLNMNRLFAGAHETYPLDDANRYELNRARRLEQLVEDFYNNYPNDRKTHLDLHTAIKPSYHKTFAIRPYQSRSISDSEKQLLLAMGIECVLQHGKASTTFSYFSSEFFDADAYTLELGRVKPFGENNPEDFMSAINSLRDLIQDLPLTVSNLSNLIEYKVVAEIIKHSDEFKFFVNDDVENFTPFPQGTLIAEDFDYNYRVAFEEEAVVFPNTMVPVGQRVAVMVTRRIRD